MHHFAPDAILEEEIFIPRNIGPEDVMEIAG